MKKDIWVVVSNSSVARIFRVEAGRTLTEVETFVHSEGRMHDRDLASDRPGSTYQSGGMSRRAVMDPKTTPKDHQVLDFAKRVANHLETSRAQGLFGTLYIAASPAFLGMLRNEFTQPLASCVEKEVAKDITTCKPTELGDYFFV